MMDKASLRREFLSKRLDLTQTEAEEKSLSIAIQTVDSLKDENFRTLHVFLPQRNKNEIDTWKIISILRHAFPDVNIAAPYIIPGTREMEHYILNTDTILIENRWGIPEPDPFTAQKVLSQDLDVILIPLLAFDKSGYRVGYGGGYYDRFLAQCRTDTLKIGLSFFEPVEMIEDKNEFDIRMDVCITPEKLWTW